MKLDTKDKIRQAQRKLIQDSRTIIKGIQTYKGSYTRQGLTRSIHHATTTPQPKYTFNSYSARIPSKYLVNAVVLTLAFPNIPVKNANPVQRDLRVLVTKLGYKIAPIESRLVHNEIFRHEARVYPPQPLSNGMFIRLDLCDYAIRPVYQGGMLSFDRRYDGGEASYKMLRLHTTQTLRVPNFDERGYFSGFDEVSREFYDSVVGLQPPKVYSDAYDEEFRAGIRDRFTRTPA